MLDFVIMARNLEQNNELVELILTNGSDLEDDFSDSSLEEDLSYESDSLESLPLGESSFLEGAFRSPPPCDLSSRLVDHDKVNFSSFPTMYNTPLLLVIEPFKEMVNSTSSVVIFVSKKSFGDLFKLLIETLMCPP